MRQITLHQLEKELDQQKKKKKKDFSNSLIFPTMIIIYYYYYYFSIYETMPSNFLDVIESVCLPFFV